MALLCFGGYVCCGLHQHKVAGGRVLLVSLPTPLLAVLTAGNVWYYCDCFCRDLFGLTYVIDIYCNINVQHKPILNRGELQPCFPYKYVILCDFCVAILWQFGFWGWYSFSSLS